MLPGPVGKEFIQGIAALSPGDQVIHVVKKMKELNPGFEKMENYGISNDQVTSLEFLALHRIGGTADYDPNL